MAMGTCLALVQAFLAMNDTLTAEHIVRRDKESKCVIL